MKKRLSGIGLFLMLLVKHPPLPEFHLFRRIIITETRGTTLRETALNFWIN